MTVEPPAPSSASASRRTRTLSRRGFLAAAFAVGSLPALSACSHLVAPRPDYAIEVLHALAARDAHLLIDANPDLAAVRSAQVTELDKEITRACGAHKDGKPVDECGSDVAAPASLATGAHAKVLLTDSRNNPVLAKALDSRTALREEHTARLATAVDGGMVLALRAAGAEWEELVPLIPSDRDEISGAEEQMTKALQAEYMMIYGVGVAAPHVGGDTTTALLARGERHRILRDRARLILEDSDVEVPESAPGYMPEDAPSPDTAPVDYMIALERYCAQAWEAVLLAANNPRMRMFALQAAGVAAAGAAALGGNNLEPLPGL